MIIVCMFTRCTALGRLHWTASSYSTSRARREAGLALALDHEFNEASHKI